MKYIIAGFGKFGRLALERLCNAFSNPCITVLELNPQQMRTDLPSNCSMINADAAFFLGHSALIDPEDVIIPMAPFHLAARFVIGRTPNCVQIPLPDQLSSMVPNPFPIDRANLCCSRADFICPDDCPEGELCTVTGAPREPLYEDLEQVKIAGFQVLVQRSFQILPGVGGFTFRDLCSLQNSIRPGKYILATSCKCHAMMTGLQRSDNNSLLAE